MTTDVRTLLQDAAETPSRAPDINAAQRRARERRRRRGGFGALVAVTVLALATGAFALASGGSDDSHVAIGLRQSANGVPDGWQTIRTDRGLSLAIPADWKSQPTSTTPIGEPVISVDDLTPDADSVLVACTTGRAPSTPPTAAGSGVNVWEFPAGSAQVPGTANDTLQVVDRPETFAGALIRGAPANGTPCANARYDQVAFSDAGRVFMVRVVTVFPSAADEEARMALAAEVLDTLRVDPVVATTTTTIAPIGVVPPPTVAAPTPTEAPLAGVTDDEKLISHAFIVWMDDQSDAGLDASVEDPGAVRGPSHEGWAQHTSDDLAQYEGRVESVQMTDADHAQVVYTILHGGQVAFSQRVGGAVRVDGQWKVSTETVCGMLALGGITCPV